MMRKVYLDGEMADKFGSEFTIYAERMSDVFRCLECNFPDLRQYLMDCHEKDIGFLCQVGSTGLDDEEELLLSLQEGDIYISPQPAGSKSALGKILAAVAIIALVYFAPQLMLASANLGGAAGSIGMSIAGFTMAATPVLIGVAVNLALTGIQQMMAPDPSTDNQQDESYIFQGSKQNIAEGDPVPVLYGELRIPGRTVSFHTRSERNQFYNQDQRATSSESNGQTYDQAGGQVSGGSSGGASAPMGGSGTIDWSVLENSLGR